MSSIAQGSPFERSRARTYPEVLGVIPPCGQLRHDTLQKGVSAGWSEKTGNVLFPKDP